MSPNLFLFLSKKKPWDGFESLTLKDEFFDDIKTVFEVIFRTQNKVVNQGSS